MRPTAGFRIALVRATDASYRGFVHLPDADVAAEVVVALPGGAVTVTLAEGTAPELQKMVAALVRAATKAEVASGRELPRKIVRWRG